MMLMIVLCFIIWAHSFEVQERDRLDDLALAVFNYNVSTIQTLYSLTGNPEAYHDQPVFREWREKYVKTRDYSPEEALYEKVEEVYDNLAMSLYSRSTAMQTLIAHWVRLGGKNHIPEEVFHPSFDVIDHMVPEKLRNRWLP
ncbi:hypothetical protein GCK32_006993 [Trichostrongylus colubriformis]|uniref:Uncharacterized protein n=1 Tax=Trichostrongylus colubriformis TaxID=6319 RepID=A0AAN8FD22_TRICO